MVDSDTLDVIVHAWYLMECWATQTDEPLEVMLPICTKIGGVISVDNASVMNEIHGTRMAARQYTFHPVGMPDKFEDCAVVVLLAIRTLQHVLAMTEKEELRSLDLLDELEARIYKYLRVDFENPPDWYLFIEQNTTGIFAPLKSDGTRPWYESEPLVWWREWQNSLNNLMSSNEQDSDT